MTIKEGATMAVIGKPIHRYCKVFSFENLCDVLETLRPLGWAVYGDAFTNAELSALAHHHSPDLHHRPPHLPQVILNQL